MYALKVSVRTHEQCCAEHILFCVCVHDLLVLSIKMLCNVFTTQFPIQLLTLVQMQLLGYSIHNYCVQALFALVLHTTAAVLALSSVDMLYFI